MGYLALTTLDQQTLSLLQNEINRRLLELMGVNDIAILADYIWNLIGNAQYSREDVANNLLQFMPKEKVETFLFWLYPKLDFMLEEHRKSMISDSHRDETKHYIKVKVEEDAETLRRRSERFAYSNSNNNQVNNKAHVPDPNSNIAICKYNVHCKYGAACKYSHPERDNAVVKNNLNNSHGGSNNATASEIMCRNWPACSFGKDCKFAHPNVYCKFGKNCTRTNCSYKHNN